MASSRIFIKGLPPTFTDSDFKKHFSRGGEVTDAKIFPNRRIGYIGYKTPEDAQKAVKYFNKTFIRMSRIGVELARPVDESRSVKPSRSAPTAQRRNLSDDQNSSENSLKRKRDGADEPSKDDPKLKEYLDVMKPASKKRAWENATQTEAQEVEAPLHETNIAIPEAQSDDEYETVPRKQKREKERTPPDTGTRKAYLPPSSEDAHGDSAVANAPETTDDPQTVTGPSLSDADWARSRTSRLLGLLDDEEEDAAVAAKSAAAQDLEASDLSVHPEEDDTVEDKPREAVSSMPTPPTDQDDVLQERNDPDVEAVRTTMRLFVRNLAYNASQEDLEAEFASYGNLEEVHIALDKKTGSAKGFAYVQYGNADSAEQAFVEKDGQPFQGRLLHILPAKAKRETKLDDFELAKLPLKKQQEIKKRREAAASTFNWNSLYMNADAVVSSVADRLGLSKSEVLDPTSSDAAIKQAHAETHIIQETKSYFRQQGVDLDSFKKSQRGDTAILAKNIPYDYSRDELKRLFEEHGDLKQFLMPPAGTIAIVEFANAAQCKAAFGALAYRRVKSSVLFLEKAPKDLFTGKPLPSSTEPDQRVVDKISTSDLKDVDTTVRETGGSATLYVRNLNFSTTSQLLSDTFKPIEGFLSARIKTKTDPKKPGQILSMGFGFVEFRTAKQAQAALQAMDGYTLEGHKIQIRASHKGADAAEERRKADAEKKAAGNRTKIIIKNLPFEASKKDVRALFSAYGQLRSVRVPKKMDRAARGFGFADFTTAKEAQSAMDALRDTHLLGRRLVLDFAAEEPEDAEAEIEKMQQKVGAQVNKVALQKLTSGGRKKFTTQNDEEES